MSNIQFVHIGHTLTATVDGKPISIKILDIALGTSETWGALITVQHSKTNKPTTLGLQNFYDWMKDTDWKLVE